jgi:putative transposase
VAYSAAMARALRINLAGAWFHVTVRGNDRKGIYRDERDRIHFLELLAPWQERFRTRLHAYVLMDNHYHLLLETDEANLSRAMQCSGGGPEGSVL